MQCVLDTESQRIISIKREFRNAIKLIFLMLICDVYREVMIMVLLHPQEFSL